MLETGCILEIKCSIWCIKTKVKSKTQDSHNHIPLSPLTPEKGNALRNDSNRPVARPSALPQLLSTKAPLTNTTASPLLKLPTKGDSHHGQTTKAPTNAPEKSYNPAGNFHLLTSLLLISVFVEKQDMGL